MPVASQLPSTSSTPRIKQESLIKQKKTQPELAPRIKLETPLKRKRVEDDDLRSPVCSPMHARHHSPNSSVKVCNVPWDRHIWSHRSSHGHCNKCMWAESRKVLVSTHASGSETHSAPHLVASSAHQHARLPMGVWAAGPAHGRHANRKLSSCAGARTRHSP
jgi:hypothetical protein